MRWRFNVFSPNYDRKREHKRGEAAVAPVRRADPSKLRHVSGYVKFSLSAVRLFDKIRDAGYEGGYDQVRRYVREKRTLMASEANGPTTATEALLARSALR